MSPYNKHVVTVVHLVVPAMFHVPYGYCGAIFVWSDSAIIVFTGTHTTNIDSH